MRSLPWVTLALALVTAGCGARTPLYEPSDAAVPDGGSPPLDIPVSNDGGCAGSLLACGAACVDPATDPRHCGGCNNACQNGGTCVAGGCVPRPVDCPGALLRCGGVCVDIRADPRHCGACDNACMGQCVLGRCEPVPCRGGLTRCAGVCVDTFSDARNCGVCNNVCAAGQSCARGACVGSTRPVFGGPTFRVASLTAEGCVTREHNNVTGDDRGGIAVGSEGVLYTGDERTAAFSEDLNVARPFMRRYDGLFSEYGSNLVGTLMSGSVPFTESTAIVDALGLIDPMGQVSNAVPLSASILLDRASGEPAGVFSGVGRLIVVQGTRAWHVDLSNPLRPQAVMFSTPRAIEPSFRCESWAVWGIAEYFRDEPWVVYVRDQQTIVRHNLFTGEVQTVASFMSLSDMCSIAAAPRIGRWYFHHEGGSQFRSGDETIGFCRGTFTM